jgi:hypothetical protein
MKGNSKQSYPVLLCSVSAQELLVLLGFEAMPAAAARYCNGKHFTGSNKSLKISSQPLNRLLPADMQPSGKSSSCSSGGGLERWCEAATA